MLYIKIENGTATRAVPHTDPIKPWKVAETTWESLWDWTSIARPTELAAMLNELPGDKYLATDSGYGVFPRFNIITMPKVGDEVSYGFNGDYYPDGKIVKVSKTLNITTSTGKTYRRQGKSGNWKLPGGTWCLCAGHINERNSQF